MSNLADSNSFRVAAYVILGVLVLVAYRRELRRVDRSDGTWPVFWLVTSVLLVAMALGRAGDLGSAVTQLGRDRAIDSGWYASRRTVQAVAVGAVGLAWLTMVAWTCWRVPERRRRYLPMSVAVTSIVAFAAIRIVSFHQVDAFLHRHHVQQLKLGSLVELSLLTAAGLITTWVPASTRPREAVAGMPTQRVGGPRRLREHDEIN